LHCSDSVNYARSLTPYCSMPVKISFKRLPTDPGIRRHPFRRDDRCLSRVGGLWCILLRCPTSKFICTVCKFSFQLNGLFEVWVHCIAGWIQWARGELGSCYDDCVGQLAFLDMAERCGRAPINIAQGMHFSFAVLSCRNVEDSNNSSIWIERH
jgi:hypothetical protein